ncbi:alpha-L-fucosidase [Mumia sp. DW29H23]|uniref:alpha-L-fucosidase n=1 Tax=Mumia sp. DW29H23 TaxID=3421241 RepID=UPI003D68C755
MRSRSRTLAAVLAGLLVAAGTALVTPSAPATASAPAAPPPTPYTPDEESLGQHQAPEWFKDAKLGFFVHWGPYSVPAFAPPDGGGARQGSDKYAEWYWYEMNHPGSPTSKHHAETYGEDFPYDRFVEEWKPSAFDPKAWLDLFVDGGAKYFVMVSKHHDGWALWDTKTSDRDTVAHGPKRDFVRELFDAAEDYPLKKGLYYSLAEWYNPAGGWDPPEHSLTEGPKNPYTGAPIPYTGYEPVADDVMDHQYPQMLELVDEFDPDLLWCDIGEHVPNNSLEVMARYYIQAQDRKRPKEVAVNDRCGPSVHDFTTPEYRNQPDIETDMWEATRGIGHSFGYNAEEDVEDYLSDEELIHSFVDTVSKGGNLLLNIGPRGDGSIPEIQADRVRALGDWLKVNGEAIYGSTYWKTAADPRSNVPVRYTVKDDAVYATALAWPGEQLRLDGTLPLRSTTDITLLGGDGKPLPWKRENGVLTVDLPRTGTASTSSRHAYTFKIPTRGAHQVVHASLDVPAQPPAAGEPVPATVTVTNPGPKRSTEGRVTLDVPDGWSATPTSAVVPELEPGASTTLAFSVGAPADAPPRRYSVTAEVRLGPTTYQASDSILLSDLVKVVSPEKLNALEVAEVGASPYVDRTWRIEQLPEHLDGQLLVPGANDDKQRQEGPMSVVDGRARVTGGNVTLARDGAGWSDYDVEVTVRPHTRGAGVMFRSPDRSNGYMWQLYPGSGLTPHVLENGTFRRLATTIPVSVEAGKEYRLRIEARGSTLRTFLDGTLVDERTDSTFATGGVGFREASNEVGEFDDVRVADPAGAVLLEDDFGSGLERWANDTMTDYLVVDLARDAEVYVAFDERGAPENGDWWPQWLDRVGFVRTDERVVTSEPSGSAMVLLKATLPAGRHVLGPNAATTSQSTSYFTIVNEAG